MMKILFKFPSRGRPEIFKNTLLSHLKKLSYNNEYKFIFTFDVDDLTMNNDEIKNFIHELNISCEIHYGQSKNKIEAINANLENQEFDILIVISDDMLPIVKNYDDIICEIFKNSENGLDNTIHVNTDRWSDILDVWCIMGKKYYKRFNYIYHPDYKSIACDNEYTEVSQMLGRKIFLEKILFFHNNIANDGTAIKNSIYNVEDDITYQRRKLLNFDIKY